MKNRLAKIGVLIFAIMMCVMATSCLTVLSTIGSMVYLNALETGLITDREVVTGDKNDLSVTFEDGKMYAVWDAIGTSDITLTVTHKGVSQSYNGENSDLTDGKVCLSDLGYTHFQDLNLTLYYSEGYNYTTTRGYNYQGINAMTYDKYTKKVQAGFKEIDYYMANRSEWFDFWSYLVIFRENYTLDKGTYEVKSTVYMGYDYLSLYETDDASKAFTYEVYSAIDAYEDSAAYSYSCEMDDSGKIGTIYLKFVYDFDPKYTSDTAKYYTNAAETMNMPHYRNNVITDGRTFAIDSVTDTIKVSSSDQLYFALKKGYRPDSIVGSNAYYLYDEMRNILSEIISDTDSKPNKVHYIHDYLVNTVLYDYDFTEVVYADKDYTTGQLFSYRCLYMEGVFGLGKNGAFNDSDRIAICDGLSKAFLSLATIEGIHALKISGTVNDEGHAWNKVEIDGVWYLVDTTWGNNLDSSTKKEYLSHEYLMVPDDKNHVETAYITYPAAMSRYIYGPGVDNNSGNTGGTVRPLFPGWGSRRSRYAA